MFTICKVLLVILKSFSIGDHIIIIKAVSREHNFFSIEFASSCTIGFYKRSSINSSNAFFICGSPLYKAVHASSRHDQRVVHSFFTVVFFVEINLLLEFE
jgi:hypothetical protein